MDRRILLIKPPFSRLYHPKASLNRLPLSLAYLAAVIRLKKPQWNVRIYNSDFSPFDHHLSLRYLTGKGFQKYIATLNNPSDVIWQEIESVFREYSPSIIGITATSQTFVSSCKIAEIAKAINPLCTVLVGGPHSSIFGQRILDTDAIDIAVLREAEETIIELLDYFEGLRDLPSIDGIAYRFHGSVLENPIRPYIVDLDSLPFPLSTAKECLVDYDDYPLQSFMYVLASRGCPFGCVFCDSRNVWGRSVRTRSVANIMNEILEIREFGLNYVHFVDDTWGLSPAFAEDLCGELKRLRPKLNWSCETHVKCVDHRRARMMRDAGCRMVQIGVESGNNRILEYMNKGITIEEAFEAAKVIKDNGMYLQTFFMVGFPDETEDSLNDTIRAMKSIPTDLIVYSTFTPSIGATCTHDGKEVVSLTSDFDATLYHHQSPENIFCNNLSKEVFTKKLRKLEHEVDVLNSRKRFRVFISKEGFLRLRQKGFYRTLKKGLVFGKDALLRA